MGLQSKGASYQNYIVTAIINGKIISKAGLACWMYDAIGIFMELTPDARFKDLISVKSEDGIEHLRERYLRY